MCSSDLVSELSYWVTHRTYEEVSQIRTGIDMLSVAIDGGTFQDGRFFQVDPGGAVPQEA